MPQHLKLNIQISFARDSQYAPYKNRQRVYAAHYQEQLIVALWFS